MYQTKFQSVSRIQDLDLDLIRIQSGQWIHMQIRIRNRIRIQEGKNDQQKQKYIKKFHVSSAGCSLLRAEGFLCSFNVLYRGLGKGKLQFLVIKTLDKNCLIRVRIKWIRIRNTASKLPFDPVLVSTFDQKTDAQHFVTMSHSEEWNF